VHEHRHHDVSTITTQFRGVFKTDKVLQQRFMDLVRK
jgi:GTP cyclohydrolase IA